MMAKTVVPQERIKELQAILAGLDPEKRKDWRLEIYDLRDGQERVSAVIDLKTGRNVNRPIKSQNEVTNEQK